MVAVQSGTTSAPNSTSKSSHSVPPSNSSQYPTPSANSTLAECGIVDVWAHNLEAEFRKIRKIIQKYPFVAMDTEFPGIVCRPIAHFQNATDYQYQQVCTNVNLLRLIQVGITFFDEQGRIPTPQSTWQFNFRFSLKYYI
jgi:CCR4-NOT transcription complex subunit 7/8